MSIENTKKIIIDLVNEKPGIKGVELITDLIASLYTTKDGSDLKISEVTKEPVELINELVEEGELIEVEYVLPTMSYRVKSLYFPKGTELKSLSFTKE